jgi:2-hydroxychromene-2-carboxylate isomerase
MKVEFYFDPISPYAWLSFYKIAELKKACKINLDVIPVAFGALITAHESLGPAEIPAKREYVWSDIMRLCMKMKLEFKSPPTHPFNSLKVLRVCQAIKDHEKRFNFAFKAADAAWQYGKDITDENVLKELLIAEKLDAEKILSLHESKEIKIAVKENTARAVKSKVFGVPSLVIDEEVFWGHDRVPLAADYLNGQLRIDSELRKKMLNRPRTADRPFWMKNTLHAVLEQCRSQKLDPKEYMNYFVTCYLEQKPLLSPEEFRQK